MRKVLALLVVVTAAVLAAGLAIPADAVRVNGGSLSNRELSRELQAIDASPAYQCFLEAREFTESLPPSQSLDGATAQTWATSVAAYWVGYRTTQLAVSAYVRQHDPAAFSANALAAASRELDLALDTQINQALADSNSQTGVGYSCPAIVTAARTLLSGSAILATLPTWFSAEQVEAEAGDLGLEALLPNAVPTSGRALAHWYRGHEAEFDTVCLSTITVLSPLEAQSVESKVAHGLAFATAARRYSKDPQASKGGAVGCFAPSVSNISNFLGIQSIVRSTRTRGVTLFSSPTGTGGEEYVIVSPTRRTGHTFSSIRASVAAAAAAINLRGAGLLAVAIQRGADVQVNPALGLWQPSQAGGSLAPPDAPPVGSVTNPAANSPAA
ncbi:MAG TPA: peptidylprolyl isomerase [Acidimicrobiales bacterium]|nr:peptidylprolyl isomerase [Acidimicrobiales bacterium]